MPPAPAGSVQQQLQRQYAYLFQMAQQLNLALEQLPETPSGSAVSDSAGKDTAAAQYHTLRSLIIKTADQVRREMEELTVSLAGTYVASSQFGEYVEQLSSYIQANPEALTQYYSFTADLQADTEAVSAAFERYRTETQAYIRTGIVYYDGAVPVYGVAVGQNLTVEDVDGEQVVSQRNFRATYTASKLSFWQDAREVAYVSNNRLYITDITVLQGLTVGSWQISTQGGLTFRWMGG